MPVSFCSKSITCLIKCFSRFVTLRIEQFTFYCSLCLIFGYNYCNISANKVYVMLCYVMFGLCTGCENVVHKIR